MSDNFVRWSSTGKIKILMKIQILSLRYDATIIHHCIEGIRYIFRMGRKTGEDTKNVTDCSKKNACNLKQQHKKGNFALR
jgi:hypothetical protein